jgi:hypothetical protein
VTVCFPRELWDNPAFHKGREWGRIEERERIIKVAQTWISEMRGHDSADCNCRHEATILENFIKHPEFEGEHK